MDISIQYQAGLFDGEGSVGLYPSKTGRSAKLLVQLTQTWNERTKLLWDWLHQEWGGSMGTSDRVNGRPAVNLQLNGAQAVEFLRAIQPHLILKSDQVELILDWWDTKEPQARDRGRLVGRSDAEWAKVFTVSQALRDMKRAPSLPHLTVRP